MPKLFKLLKFIFQVFTIINLLLMYGDICLGEYGWVVISGACALVCYYLARLLDSVEIK
jgi:hypothetical protein